MPGLEGRVSATISVEEENTQTRGNTHAYARIHAEMHTHTKMRFAQHSTVQYSTAQHITTQHSTAQHSTARTWQQAPAEQQYHS